MSSPKFPRSSEGPYSESTDPVASRQGPGGVEEIVLGAYRKFARGKCIRDAMKLCFGESVETGGKFVS